MSEKQTETFIELCLKGNALLEEVDDYVDYWHNSSENVGLRNFLGMSKSEYSLWLNDPDVLPYVIYSRREERPFVQVVNDNYYSEARLAARSDQSHKIRLLKDWLERHGYLDQ